MARARLSVAFEDLRGKFGSQIVTRTRAGLVTKRPPKYRYPKNAAVEQGAERMRQANAIWNELTFEQVGAWDDFGQQWFRREPVTMQRYALNAKSAFIALTTKFIQLNPGAEVPLLPPSSDFYEQSVTVSYEPIGEHSFRHCRASDQGPERHQLAGSKGSLTGDAVVLPDLDPQASGVLFTASGPNTGGAVTELMFQKLLNIRRSPTKYYKALAFHAFEEGDLSLFIPLEPGVYAFAYRFVLPATGQQMDWSRMVGILEVG